MLTKHRASLASLAALVLIGVWVDITGYLDVFADPSATDRAKEAAHYACYVGRVAVAALFALLPRQIDWSPGRLAPAVLGLMLGGTVLYSFGFHQSLFDPLLVCAAGSLLLGASHIWAVSAVYAYIACVDSRREALYVLVAAQVLERLAAETVGYLLNETALIVASYALPVLGVGALLLSDRLFAHYRPRRTAAPSEVGGAAAQRYFVALCVMAGVGLVACGAMSTVGIWGNAGSGQYAGETWSILAAMAECLLVVLLCRATFLSKERKPLALRYQSSLLVLITAFALTSSRQMLYALPAEAVDALLVTVENYAHILFWVVALDAAGSLGWPIYRAFSVGLLSCSVTGLVWSVFLEHRMAAAESAVFIVFYLIIIACMVYPQAFNRTSLRSSSSEEDLNAFVLDGERRLTAGVNGKMLQEALELRCANIAQEYALSAREGEVLVLLVKGETRQNMCRELHLSEGTVKTHLTHIYKKLGIHTQSELLDISYDTGKG